MTAAEVLKFAEVKRPRTRRHLLCLSGGGFRGLYTALVLEALERRAGRPLGELFDVIAGTSIGGVIAAGVALGVPVARMRRVIEKHGPAVFDGRMRLGRKRLPVQNRLRALYRARYPQERLRDVVRDAFPDQAQRELSAIDKPLVVCAVHVDQSAPGILLSAGLSDSGGSRMTLEDALLSTTAAPTYFPTHRIGKFSYVDGGLVANAPDLVALTEAVRKFGCPLEDVWVLSVGTAGAPHRPRRSAISPGLVEWVVWKGLVQMTLSAQEQLAVDQCRVLLADRYVRVDSETEGELRLDSASAESAQALRLAAKATIEKVQRGTPNVEWALRGGVADDDDGGAA